MKGIGRRLPCIEEMFKVSPVYQGNGKGDFCILRELGGGL